MNFRITQKVIGNLVTSMQEVRKEFNRRHNHPFEEMGAILVRGAVDEARTWLEIAEKLGLEEEIKLSKELYETK